MIVAWPISRALSRNPAVMFSSADFLEPERGRGGQMRRRGFFVLVVDARHQLAAHPPALRLGTVSSSFSSPGETKATNFPLRGGSCAHERRQLIGAIHSGEAPLFSAWTYPRSGATKHRCCGSTRSFVQNLGGGRKRSTDVLRYGKVQPISLTVERNLERHFATIL